MSGASLGSGRGIVAPPRWGRGWPSQSYVRTVTSSISNSILYGAPTAPWWHRMASCSRKRKRSFAIFHQTGSGKEVAFYAFSKRIPCHSYSEKPSKAVRSILARAVQLTVKRQRNESDWASRKGCDQDWKIKKYGLEMVEKRLRSKQPCIDQTILNG
jgi:hypothetical protein